MSCKSPGLFFGFPNRFSLKLNLVGVMQEPVADSVSDSGFANQMMPLLGGVLTGDDRGTLSMTIFDDLQEVFSFGVRQGGD